MCLCLGAHLDVFNIGGMDSAHRRLAGWIVDYILTFREVNGDILTCSDPIITRIS